MDNGDSATKETNPSRIAEGIAAEFVQLWCGTSAKVYSLGRGDTADLSIEYQDGRRGLGEVKTTLDGLDLATSSAMRQFGPPHEIQLTAGLGSWSLTVGRHVNVKRLRRGLEVLVAQLGGETKLEIYGNWPTGHAADLARSLGIRRIERTDAFQGDLAFYLLEGDFGVIPSEPIGLESWLDSFLSDSGKHQDSWARLRGSEIDERHVLIWINDDVPDGVRRYCSWHPDKVPTSTPRLPVWMTYLWLLMASPFSTNMHAWVLGPTTGWQLLRLSKTP